MLHSMNIASLRLALRFLRSAELSGRQQVQLEHLVREISELLKNMDDASDQRAVPSATTPAVH